ncbi:MAG: thiamine phosphate synthase [Gallionella sp.]
MSQKSNSRISGLYAITQDEPDTPELLRKVTLALQGGAQVLQYRNKIAGKALRQKQAAALRELTSEFGVPLIINDDTLLAREIAADGVHLGASDGSLSGARELLGESRLIGVSCYNSLELAREAQSGGADYVAFGSFYPSSVKPRAVTATPDLLRQASKEINIPLVAIGGITLENGKGLLIAGAHALAIISAVFCAADIEMAARRFAEL